MSGANADPQDSPSSVDEWRVDSVDPPGGVTRRPDVPAGSPHGEASTRRARVRADLSSWQEELQERMRRLEGRLARASRARR